VAVEARQERRLRLSDDIARDPHHHVVEAAVLEVILDARATRPRNRAVDHVELAVIGPPELVLPSTDPLAVRVQAVPARWEDIVDDDLRPGGGEACKHLPRLLVRPGTETVDNYPNLNALLQLPLQQCCHLHPDLALAPAEHQDVHRRPCPLDIGEDPREEVHALHQRLDRPCRRPREGKCCVVRAG
jgi:hypothetical protein